jgi:hypothetical protein
MYPQAHTAHMIEPQTFQTWSSKNQRMEAKLWQSAIQHIAPTSTIRDQPLPQHGSSTRSAAFSLATAAGQEEQN